MRGRTAIGLDIGTSVVRAVELSYGRGGITLERFGQVVLPEGAVQDGEVVQPATVAECLKELWSATRLTHRRVVLGVANERVLVRQTDIPWVPQNELRSALPFHAESVLPVSVKDSVLDFFPLEEGTNAEGVRMMRGLLVAAGRDTVLANVRCAERAGLKVEAVDLTPFAVLRSLGKQTGPYVETEALVDVGAKVTNIVVHSAGAPLFVRILLMGGQDVTNAIKDDLDVPLAQAEAMKQQPAHYADEPCYAELRRSVETTAQRFVDEVADSLDYYAAANPGSPVQRILLVGGGSRLEGLVDLMAAQTRLPVLGGDPMANLRIGRTGLDDAQLDFVRPLAAVPVGLALGALA